jgi:hypothetical protein
MESPYVTPYQAYRDNKRVIATLTPLVTLLININKLVKPSKLSLSDANIDDVFEFTPDTVMRNVNSLKNEMRTKKLLDKQLESAINELKHDDVWLPFGYDNEKNGSEFNPAVKRAIVAANYIIGQLQHAAASSASSADSMSDDESDISQQLHEAQRRSMALQHELGVQQMKLQQMQQMTMQQMQQMPMAQMQQMQQMQQMPQMQQMQQMPQMPQIVELVRDSAPCLHVYDNWTSKFVKAKVGERYDLSVLFCLTPRGFVRDLVGGIDFNIADGILTLNPANVKQISFRLTKVSHDHPKVTFSTYEQTIPFNRASVTEPLHVYVPQNQQDVVIPISYHSDYVDVPLPSITASQLRPDISIDPTSMIEQFAGDLQNVHLHANLQLPECPMEELVSARVNFARLTEPICSFLDLLFQSTETRDDSMYYYASKIPYIYTIDMRTMTCTKRQIMSHELEKHIPIVTLADFESFNQHSQLEEHLIRYTMFQMMLSYRKFTFVDFLTCPEHSITFDLYLRRGAGEVGYHYDLTPGNIVSSVGLLYSMHPGHVKVGPQLIPRRYRRDRQISDTNVTPMSAFIMRNSAVLFNNATYSHSTPDVEHFMSREPYDVGHEVKDQQHRTIYHTTLHVTHAPITFPESIKEKLKESSQNPSRTFLRSWHIVDISDDQRKKLGTAQPVVFSNGRAFHEMATETMTACFEWLGTSRCMCIEVGFDAATQEIVPPLKMPGHLQGGRIMPSVSAVPNPQQLKVLSPQQLKTQQSQQSQQLKQLKPLTPLKPQSKTQYSQRSKMASPVRASSTLSISHLKQQIGSKLKKIRAILKNPKKNFVVMSGRLLTQRRARSHSHTQYAPKKRSHTRKVRSAV